MRIEVNRITSNMGLSVRVTELLISAIILLCGWTHPSSSPLIIP